MDETLPTSPETYAPIRGRVLVGRYRLDTYLGRGGSGTVFCARDLLADCDVAVKVLRDIEDARDRSRVRREIGLLRALRIPGVTRLLDEGVDDEVQFLVMEFIDGQPFPGPSFDGTWESFRPLVVDLLEVLRQVHVRGVIHRDLEPANILVDADGAVQVLDFGLSVSGTMGTARMDRGFVYGTPAYLAPEQVRGGLATPQTDLYAVGVLMYEALCGRLPHAVDNIHRLIAAKVSTQPIPPAHYRPDLAPHVLETIGELLAMEAQARPASAARVIRQLQGDKVERSFALRWVGPRAHVHEVLEAVRRGESVDVVGVTGTGRTRVLAEIQTELAREGQGVHRCAPGAMPYASLGAIHGIPEPPDTEDIADFLVDQLGSHWAQRVVLVDDWERIDRWSAVVLERLRDRVAVVRACRTPSAGGRSVTLPRWEPEDLEVLFTASSRFGSLAKDAALELHARTQGMPALVDEELGCWRRAGIARLDDEAFSISRSDLDRLITGLDLRLPSVLPERHVETDRELEELLSWMSLAWPCSSVNVLATLVRRPIEVVRTEIERLVNASAAEWVDGERVRPCATTWLQRFPDESALAKAHSLVARSVAPGTEGRMMHLLAADEAEDVAAEAVLVARRAREQGHRANGVEALAEALRAVRRHGLDREESILREWLLCALSSNNAFQLDRVRYSVSRAGNQTPALRHFEQLAQAAIIALSEGGERGLRLLDEVPAFDDVEIESWRLWLRASCAHKLTLADGERVFAELQSWAQGRDEPSARVALATAEGQLRYRQGRFREAAVSYGRAADCSAPGALVSVWGNQADAWLEAFEPTLARDAALRARDLARELRRPYMEARAEYQLRSAAYRMGVDEPPDAALLQAVVELGHGRLETLLRLVTAAAAWRLAHPTTSALSKRAHASWMELGATLPARLSASIGMVFDRAGFSLSDIQREAERTLAKEDFPRARVQILGMLALALPDGIAVPSTWRETAHAHAECVQGDHREMRLEVLSIQEALDALGGDFSLRRLARSA